MTFAASTMTIQTRLFFIYLLLIVLNGRLTAQSLMHSNDADTLEPVIITSSKTLTPLGNVTVPTSIIQSKTMEKAGMLRLKDVLQEQTGLAITSAFGAGIQMQGLNPDYTLILLNGEPLIGRTSGVLDLNRISLNNIERIEIVKGPSSSLYGSEAMGGVINIITRTPEKSNFQSSVRYGVGNPDKGWVFPTDEAAFHQTDIQLAAGTRIGQSQLSYNANWYYVDGISFRPFSNLRDEQPIHRISNQLSWSIPSGKKSSFSLVYRNGYDYIKQSFSVSNNGTYSNTFGKESNSDNNAILSWKYRINNRSENTLKAYGSWFKGGQYLRFSNKPDSSYTDEFIQRFFRIENQTDYTIRQLRLTGGVGFSIDQANSTRYDNIQNRKQNNIAYIYTQAEWNPIEKFTLIAGFRYDHHTLFQAAWSPKLSFRYKANEKFSIRASIGRGFKAPDFRQLYLNFTNVAAGGYSVVGSIDAVRIIQQLDNENQILEYKDDYNRLATLKPEFSTGINIGTTIKPFKNIKLDLHFFRNDIESMIDVRQVATRINGGQIFSYINVKKAFTQGYEFDLSFQPNTRLHLQTGYQFLTTADKDELSDIKKGIVYTKNEDGTSRLLRQSEYTGLPNRSAHTANLKCTYEDNQNRSATLRLIYRSRWYVSDKDGNGLYNTGDEYANGFLLINASVGFSIHKSLRCSIGMDNILNYTDARFMPTMQGRMTYLTFSYSLHSLK